MQPMFKRYGGPPRRRPDLDPEEKEMERKLSRVNDQDREERKAAQKRKAMAADKNLEDESSDGDEGQSSASQPTDREKCKPCSEPKQGTSESHAGTGSAVGHRTDVDMAQLCSICLDRPKTHAILPCMHKCVCEKCGGGNFKKLVKTCPICRKKIKQIKQVFE